MEKPIVRHGAQPTSPFGSSGYSKTTVIKPLEELPSMKELKAHDPYYQKLKEQYDKDQRLRRERIRRACAWLLCCPALSTCTRRCRQLYQAVY